MILLVFLERTEGAYVTFLKRHLKAWLTLFEDKSVSAFVPVYQPVKNHKYLKCRKENVTENWHLTFRRFYDCGKTEMTTVRS